MKKIIVLVLVAVALLLANISVALAITGKGTQSDPYVISNNPDDLPQWFKHNFEGCWFERTKDVWLLVDGSAFESGDWKSARGEREEQEFVKKKDFIIKARKGSFRLRAGVDWEVNSYYDEED
ncbi:MAG: hypothetical protein LBI74_02390 [Synergistaceae bacterium]|nr:hypothetical protein [Synergistaceae bacterium]